MTPARETANRDKSLFTLAAELGLLDLSDIIQKQIPETTSQTKANESRPSSDSPFHDFSRLT